MRKGWKEITLKDASTKIGDGLHGTPSYSDDGEYYFVNGNNLREGKIVISGDTKRISESEYQKIKKDLDDRTVLVAINGTLGNIGLYKGEKIALGKSACYINVKPDISVKYMRYVLEFEHFQNYADLFATGSTIKNLGLKAVRNYKFLLPPLTTQRKIASILSAYDDLIENNLKRIKLLEEKAQLTYEEWFVRMKFPGHETTPIDKETGLPEGWEKVKLDLILKASNGKTFKGEYLDSFDLSVYGSNGIIGQSNVHNNEDSIIIGRVGAYCGSIKYCKEKFWATDNTITVTSIDDRMPNLLAYYVLDRLELRNMAGGSAQPLLTQRLINNLELIAPVRDLASQFDSYARKHFDSVSVLEKQNQLLKEARDLLLPRLMSGMIDVGELDVKLEEIETK